MGQKANILTLRKSIINSYAANSNTFLNTNEYMNTLKRSLEKKNVILISHSFDVITGSVNLSLNLFFRTRKVQRYLKKKLKVNRPLIALSPEAKRALRKKENSMKGKSMKENSIKGKPMKENSIKGKPMKGKPMKRKFMTKISKHLKNRAKIKRFKPQWKRWRIRKMRIMMRKKGSLKKVISKAKKNKIKFLKKKSFKNIKWTKTLSNLTKDLPNNNLIVSNITLINKQVNLKVVRIVHSYLKFFRKMLFSRRFDFYYDFLKLTSLFIIKKVELRVYNTILGRVFKFLMKKSHNKFFNFLKKLAHVLTRSSTIEGVKFGINGRLKGKLRAKSFKLEIGKIGKQTIVSEIDFSKVHINTLYGCFGLKTWIKYK